jgi:2-polyprenyl-3-methyl-5-hydroxy-6-metoxy-1,4-benzoquinol methylase
MASLAGKWRGLRLEFAHRYGRSVQNVAKRNTRRGFEKLFAADDLLDEYLSDDRLAFYDEVASIAAPYAQGSIVDMGCGSGNLLRAVLDRVAANRGSAIERVLALDYADSAVRRAADLVPEAEGRTFDIMSDQLDGELFDLVLCTEVLEHLRRPTVARDQLAQACAAGGTILVTVPDGALDSWEGHLNFWNEDELGRFLEPIGATTVRRIDAGRGLLALVTPG